MMSYKSLNLFTFFGTPCMLITKRKEQHYVLIKDFNKFMYNQTKHKERKHFCLYCLQCLRYEKAVTNHKEHCIAINRAQAIKMPKADIMVQVPQKSMVPQNIHRC